MFLYNVYLKCFSLIFIFEYKSLKCFVKLLQQESSDCESIATDNSCITEYILQVYEDGGSQDGMFHSVYEGDEMQFTFTFAEPYKTYSFRVCQHTIAGAGVYGPWSMTKKACTTLSPHGEF